MDSFRPWLAMPEALWLLGVFPVLMAFAVLAWFLRRRALRRLGSLFALQGLTVRRRWAASLRRLTFSTGLFLLVLGIAGPQWGHEKSQAVASGRDLVVVLDLSQSMLAEQPSRQERARRALLDLADALEKRGGHRIGLVVFAARAKLVCPLTHDYDHFRDALKQQDASLLPEDLSPAGAGAASGTRIGAGLREAVAAHDPRFTGYQDILLVSDGDDPATDREWSEGAEAAHSRRIPVYTVGVGDPDTRGEIWVAGVPLKHNGAAVRTKLEEGPLLEIARRTGGTYLPVRTHTLPPGRLLREVLEARAVRDYDEAALPVLKPRYPWFFGAALAFFALSIVIADRRRPRPEKAVSEDSPATVTTVVVPAATVRKVTAAATELLNQNQP